MRKSGEGLVGSKVVNRVTLFELREDPLVKEKENVVEEAHLPVALEKYKAAIKTGSKLAEKILKADENRYARPGQLMNGRY